MPNLTGFADNELGVAAFNNGKIFGFLYCYTPWYNVFGTTRVKGTFSPVHTVYKNREMICKRLYQTAAEKSVINGSASHVSVLNAQWVWF